MVEAFEHEFSEKVGIPYAAAVSSGTAAIHLTLRILGVEQGDEVIASTLTFIGGVTPIIFQGAMPVFIDSDSSSWTMDPDLLAEELESCKKRGKLPKAVIPTDLYGQCADLDRILELCAPYDISPEQIKNAILSGKIIEDYPEDKYGPSCLIFGLTKDGKILHVQCSMDPVWIVTAYDPTLNPEEWDRDYKRRRKKP